MIKRFKLNIKKKRTWTIKKDNYTKPLITSPDIMIAERNIKRLTRKKGSR